VRRVGKGALAPCPPRHLLSDLILVTQRAPGEVEYLARWRTGDRLILGH